MTDELLLAERFEAERPRLRGLALRMLGGEAAADDAVQEAWIRLVRTDQGGEAIDNLPGWLTTVVSRICLDLLRSRTSRREATWPDDAELVDTAPTPEEEAELVEAVGQAMTVVLDTLSPAERLAYVLKDVFAVPFDEIAPILGRSEVATRQLASRARRRLQEPQVDDGRARTWPPPTPPWWTRSWPRPATTSSPPCSSCSTRTPRCGSTTPPGPWAARRRPSRAAARSRRSSPAGRRPPCRRPSTVAPPSCWQHLGDIKVVFAFTVVDGRVKQIELLADPSVLTRVARRSPRRS